MKITIIQTNIFWEDKLGNLEMFENIISSLLPGTDIVILPEMFNTGFSMNPSELAEQSGSVTFEWMREISVKGGFGICGSYIINRNNRFYNTWLFVSPEGEIYSYDKRHLFSPGNEDKFFTPGDKRVVFTFRGVRICPTICYDLRFPVWSRNRNDYDLLINSANWPESRRDVWITLLKARAIENQCFVAGANRVGTDGTGIKYCGDSLILNPFGEMIGIAGRYAEEILTCEISIDDLNTFRNKFQVWKDADDYSIRL